MSESERAPENRIFIAELAPDEIGAREIGAYLEIGFTVIANITSPSERERLGSLFGTSIQYAAVPLLEGDLLDFISSIGGCEVIKLRRNVPIADRFITSSSRAEPPRRKLKLIAQSGSGVNHIDLASAARNGVRVTYTPGGNAQAVAEHVLRSMLSLATRSHAYARDASQGEWSKGRYGLGSELHGKTLGLIGVGASATKTAHLARAIGMQVSGFGGSRFDDRRAAELGIQRAHSLEELIAESDYISIHVPLNTATEGLIGTREIRLMRKGAMLINASRGGVVDEQALADDLSSSDGRLGGVALDVFQVEGDGFRSPLLEVENHNVILTPHIAGSTRESLLSVTLTLSAQVGRLMDGETAGVPLAF